VNPQENTLVAVARLLDKHGLPYMVIGGMANAVWGVPRATLDIDVTVWTGATPIEETIPCFTEGFRLRVEDPAEFVLQTRVLPVESFEGVAVDVIYGLLPFEEQAIKRAVVRLVAGYRVRFCTAEDLVLMKIISDRPKDLGDARTILERRRDQLDQAYLEPRVRELADLLEKPEILVRFTEWST